MSFLKNILPIFRLFQITCIYPISIGTDIKGKHNPETRSFKFLKWFSIAVISTFIALFVFCIANSSFYEDPKIAAINRSMDIAQVSAIHLVVIITLTESLVKRQRQLQIIDKIDEIDKILVGKLKINLSYDVFRQNIYRQAIYWVTESIYIFVIVFTTGPPSLSRLWLLYCVPLFISGLKYFQYTVYVSLLRNRLHILLLTLRNMTIREDNQGKFVKEYLIIKMDKAYIAEVYAIQAHQQIVYIRTCYHLLWETSVLINDCFHWTLIALIGNDFIVLVKNLYWLVYELRYDRSWASLLLTGHWSILNILRFGIMTKLCHEANKNLRNISVEMFKMNINMVDNHLANLVSIQLM